MGINYQIKAKFWNEIDLSITETMSNIFVQLWTISFLPRPRFLVLERAILEEKGQKRKTMRLMNGSRVADVSLSPRVTCILRAD